MSAILYNPSEPETTTTPTVIEGQPPLSKWRVDWIENLDYRAVHTESGDTALFTLSPADQENARFDLFVEEDNQVIVLEGVPSENPAEPQINPFEQLKIRFVKLEAGATEPSGAAKKIIYDEAVGHPAEFQGIMLQGDAGSITLNDEEDPNTGVKHIAFRDADQASIIALVSQEVEDLTPFSALEFSISILERGYNGCSLKLFNGSEQVGIGVLVGEGAFGFDDTIIGQYQTIRIPLSAFMLNTMEFTNLQFTAFKNRSNNASTFYLDTIQLIGEGEDTTDTPTAYSDFLALTDTPTTYSDHEGHYPVVYGERLVFKPIALPETLPIITVMGDKWFLKKHPDNNSILQTEVLQVGDYIINGSPDNKTFWPLAIYLGGDKDVKASYNPINPIEEIPQP